MPETYDAIVIGTGRAGRPMTVRLGREGLKTAIIGRHLMGGSCVNLGCIPTKTLVGKRPACLPGAATGRLTPAHAQREPAGT